MIYMILYHGGPRDGQQVYSPRPLDTLEDNGHIYAAEIEGEDGLEWVDDETRICNLHHAGKGNLRDWLAKRKAKSK